MTVDGMVDVRADVGDFEALWYDGKGQPYI
jgi:hypothetical protein